MRTESRQNSRFSGRRVHFIGIGGCGMSGLARVLLDAGATVSGTDLKPSPATRELIERGVRIAFAQDGALLDEQIDLVVRTAAVPDSNPEFQRAKKLGLNHLKYAQVLGQVMEERFGIAVSGTHGKTSTTSMIAFGLLNCGQDPSFVIGGTVQQLGGSSRSGAGEAFVVEACEFDRSFHNYLPRVAVLTNVEKDHLDCYRNGLDEIIESFHVFAERVLDGGLIIANGQDANVRRALEGVDAAIQWVGFDEIDTLDWAVLDTGLAGGCHTGDIYRGGKKVAEIRLSVPGRHNLFNALASVAACAAAGADPAAAAEAIGRFIGADRRATRIGECNGAVIVDDYGHHPTEVRTTLKALREKYLPARLICVFQPHQHSRTRDLMDEFATCFGDADEVVLPDIYAARDTEADVQSVSTADLVARIVLNGQNAVHVARLGDVIDYIRNIARPGDVVATMGAGNICDVGYALANRKLGKDVA